ncbi:MAG: hypothetical protein KME47_09495 [Nodosilinea sp. WJT8-NPBG4]|jgi:hypothetical protein|nr:hypothetical protein [Nodosilinea sp. WJT8-NPBG4]
MVRRKVSELIGKELVENVNVDIHDEDLPVVEEIIESIIGPIEEVEPTPEAPATVSIVDTVYAYAQSVGPITDDVEAARVRHYLEALYLKHGDKFEELTHGYETLYGLTMLAAFSGIPTNNTFKIEGQHSYDAYQHYKRVIKNV